MGRNKGIFGLLAFLVLLPSNAFSYKNAESGHSQACGLELSDCGRSRMVRDPATGLNWFFVRDERHPGWPAKLVRGAEHAGNFQASTPAGKAGQKAEIIRTGDVLSVWEETATFRAVLEGVALSTGVAGDVIRVRLRFAGTVIEARVLSHSKACLVRDGNGGCS